MQNPHPYHGPPRKQTVQQWIRENYGERDFAANAHAREVRRLNQQRYEASLEHTQRPARVS